MMLYRTFAIVILLLTLNWPVYGNDGTIRSRDWQFSGIDFSQGTGENIRVTADGLTLAAGQSDGRYNSPIFTAPIPFNVAVPQWEADLPPGSGIIIWLRTANGQGAWSEWHELHESHDMTLPEDTAVIGDFIAVPGEDVTHGRFQFSVTLRRLSDEAPTLRHFAATFIDATGGPTLEEMIARQEEINASQPAPQNLDAYPKPFVLSRAVWCQDPACHHNNLLYAPVTHLVVHHTASSNSSANWANAVRAIWHFHTFTRGWGDIGYNYLVDPNGVLYEGYLGGNDVIGAHAGGANAGSMGLSFIGNFTSYVPPSPMFTSAINLLAWKADQKGIDVYSASQLAPNVNRPTVRWGLPHLMGHRDIYGNTECPGEKLHELLPWMKNEIAQRIGFTSPYVYIDELTGAFSKSAANWYSTKSGCGFNRHAYYTWSTTDPAQSVNWGMWRLDLPADGRYEIAAYLPYCLTGSAETEGATYQIGHADRISSRVFSQEEHVGRWLVLGNFDFFADQDNWVFLSDLTETESWLGVWFDALRWRPATDWPPTATFNEEPEDLTAVGDWPVEFRWRYASDVITLGVQLQAAATPDFTDLILAVDLPPDADHYSHFFDGAYEILYWRVAATTHFHGVVWSEPTRFILDRIAPVSTVGEIYTLFNNQFIVNWSGYDGESAVIGYNLDYRAEDSLEWTRWLTHTGSVTAVFAPPILDDRETVYWFRSQAIDAAGNIESPHPNPGDTHTGAAVPLDMAVWLPMVQR